MGPSTEIERAQLSLLRWNAKSRPPEKPPNIRANKRLSILTAASCPPSRCCRGCQGPGPQSQPDTSEQYTLSRVKGRRPQQHPRTNNLDNLCWLDAVSHTSACKIGHWAPGHVAYQQRRWQQDWQSVNHAAAKFVASTSSPTCVLRSLRPKYSGPAMAVRGGGGRFSPAAMRWLMVALMRLRICSNHTTHHRCLEQCSSSRYSSPAHTIT